MTISFSISVLLFLASFVLALAITPLLRGIVKRGRDSANRIPPLGGVAIFLSFVLPLGIMLVISQTGNLDKRFLGVMTGACLVLLVGIYDDLRGSPVWSRLLIEIAAAVLVYFAGIGIHALPNPLGAPLQLGWLSLPATVLWIVLISNAVNFIDGLDGLAVGNSMLILLTIMLLNWGHLSGLHLLAVFALLGALSGFLLFNFPPASIYMGDSGSLFLGFFLSSFALAVSQLVLGTRSMGITALAFAIPLLDMGYAVLRRWYRGVPIYKADKDHLHHKLLQKGFSGRKVVLLFYAANLALMLALLLLLKLESGSWLQFAILMVLSLSAFAAFQFLSELKPRDFAGKILALFRSFRKRRYCLYLINRFEKEAEKKSSFDDIQTTLDNLFQDYGVNYAEIRAADKMLYSFGVESKQMDHYEFSFTVCADKFPLEKIHIEKAFSSGYLMCTGELAEALTNYLCKNHNQ